MRKKDDNMMHSVNDDLLDDLDDDNEDSILEDSHDLEVVNEDLILIFEICLDECSEDDLDDEDQEFVNEKISKKLLKLALRIHICDVKRKLVTLE
jgi:hypothetical protein